MSAISSPSAQVVWGRLPFIALAGHTQRDVSQLTCGMLGCLNGYSWRPSLHVGMDNG